MRDHLRAIAVAAVDAVDGIEAPAAVDWRIHLLALRSAAATSTAQQTSLSEDLLMLLQHRRAPADTAWILDVVTALLGAAPDSPRRWNWQFSAIPHALEAGRLDLAERLLDAVEGTEPDADTMSNLILSTPDGDRVPDRAQLTQVLATMRTELRLARVLAGSTTTLQQLRSTAQAADEVAAWHHLALATHNRGIRTGDLELLAEAVRAADRAQQLATTADERDEPLRIRASALDSMVENGRTDLVDESVAAAEAAAPTAGPDVLARALLRRYHERGRRADLDRARTLIDTGPDASPRALWVAAMVLGEVFDMGRDIADLDDGLAAAVRSTVGSQAAGGLITAAALSRRRFMHSGDLADLDRAVAYLDRVLKLEPEGTPAHYKALMNKATALSSREAVTNDRADLDGAIDVLERALAAPHGSRARALTNYGNSLLRRAEKDSDPGGLAAALDALTESVALTEDDSPYLARRRLNLGNGHLVAAARFDLADHLDQAIDKYRLALAGLPDGSPFRQSYLASLGSALRRRGTDADLDEAVTCLREVVLDGAPTAPYAALTFAPQLADLYVARREIELAADVLREATAVLSMLVQVQQRQAHRETWLAQVVGLPAAAARLAAACGRVEEAVHAVEHGRAVVLSRLLERDARDVAGLRAAGHDRLARRWDEVVGALSALEGVDLADRDLANPITHTRAVRALQTELREIEEEAQRLLPSVIPADYTAVYLVPSKWGGVALVCRSEQFSAVSLPHLQDDAVRTLVSALYADPDPDGAGFADLVTEIGQWLWGSALQPVVAELGGLPDVIVPVGLVGLLPLQAAEPTLDLGPVVTAPNIRVWLEARHRVRPVSPGTDGVDVLAVGDPVGDAPLRLAATEARLVDSAFGATGRALTGTDALAPVVAERLKTAAVVHLACHGEADLLEPTPAGSCSPTVRC